MSKANEKLHRIPVVESGSKYRTDAGFSAIKNGQKQGREAAQEERPGRRAGHPMISFRMPLPRPSSLGGCTFTSIPRGRARTP